MVQGIGDCQQLRRLVSRITGCITPGVGRPGLVAEVIVGGGRYADGCVGDFDLTVKSPHKSSWWYYRFCLFWR